MRDSLHLVGRVEPPVEGVNFVAEAVESFEQRVELSVVEMLSRLRHRG